MPQGDPTVLFTPAGMNQFKREFMGLGDPTFKRAATCQKCIRTGDIENVGKTPRHMTFFEMLGNFSFGDYFKREAIHWAWEFLTRTLRISPDRLTVTVYLDDDEAYDIWRNEVKLPADRITRMGEDDNFWPAGAPSHGPNGVCGPCSEIFYHGDGIDEVEIWNLVFTQFNRVGPGQLEPLPNKNIDTGMGLERMAAALQGVPSNFAIDIMTPIVAAAAETLGVSYQADKPDGIRIRRMADHVRTLTFCIHENVQPSEKKQGYIVRRLLRRAVLDGYRIGRREPFLHELIPAVAETMKRPYPELVDSVPRIRHVVREEEERFLRNLENGVKLLDDTFRRTKAAGSDTVSGELAFELNATYGIPVEITEDLAADQNLRVDMPGFKKAQETHGQISRGKTEAFDVFATGPLDTLKESYHHGSEFLGYETTAAEGHVIGILEQTQLAESASASEGDGGPPVVLVLDRTPFYGESGGQVGDTGTIRGEGYTFRVDDTKRDNDFTLHIGRVTRGTVTIGEAALAEVDAERRQAIRRAHSATHVLHAALHEHLGKHAQQAGSKVEPDRLRFDFANPEAVGKDRLRQIEETVNTHILRGDAVSWTRMPIAEAKQLGAMALFGEKYPEVVRVVQMGGVLAGTLWRHAPGQYRPDRPAQGHRRGVGLGRDPPDHRADGQGRPGLRSPGRRRAGRGRGVAPRGPRPGLRAGRGAGRGGQGPQEAGIPASQRPRWPSNLGRRHAGRRDHHRWGAGHRGRHGRRGPRGPSPADRRPATKAGQRPGRAAGLERRRQGQPGRWTDAGPHRTRSPCGPVAQGRGPGRRRRWRRPARHGPGRRQAARAGSRRPGGRD